MKKILELLDHGETKKSKYVEMVSGLSETLDEYLKQEGYEEDRNENITIFRLSSKERLCLMQKQLRESKHDEKCFVPFGVEQCFDNFNAFLDIYNIGHTSKFSMNKSGWIDVNLYCRISKSFRDDRKISERDKFQKQMEQLKQIGITLEEGRNSIKIPFTQSNTVILKEMIKKIGGRRIQISFEEDNKDNLFLREISFMIKPEALLEYVPVNKESVMKSDKDPNLLTDDEIVYIKKLLCDISDAIKTINDMPSLLQTCGSVIESQVFDLCKIFDIETNISKRYLEGIKEERKTNQKIRELKEELKKDSINVAIGKQFQKVIDEVDIWAKTNLSFDVRDADLDQYGNLTIQFAYQVEDFLEEGLLSRETLEKRFLCVKFPGSDDEIYMIGCDQNKDKINEMITEKFRGSEITEWNYIERADMMVLRTFKLRFCW